MRLAPCVCTGQPPRGGHQQHRQLLPGWRVGALGGHAARPHPRCALPPILGVALTLILTRTRTLTPTPTLTLTPTPTPTPTPTATLTLPLTLPLTRRALPHPRCGGHRRLARVCGDAALELGGDAQGQGAAGSAHGPEGRPDGVAERGGALDTRPQAARVGDGLG